MRMLSSDSAYILDCYTELFIWIGAFTSYCKNVAIALACAGKDSGRLERAGAYKIAQGALTMIQRPPW
jgi:hypothetical protein